MVKDLLGLVREEAEKMEVELSAISRYLYENPELSFEEKETSRYLRGYLEDKGFSIERGTGGMKTAFLGRLKVGRGKKPRLGYLAEMDALPELGHACGHNIVAASSTGAASIVARIAQQQDIPGEITCFGTPAEEQGFGKARLAEKGLFDGIDAIMMVHPSSRRVVDKGYLALKKISFTFLGKSAHAAAYPEHGVNALDAMILFFNSVAHMRQQLPGEARVHGIITEGGVAPNIIPERTESYYYVRARTMDVLEETAKKLKNCARGAAKSTGCRVKTNESYYTLKPMKINPVLASIYREGMDLMGLLEDDVPRDKNLGSSDIGNVSFRAPAIQPLIPITEGGKRIEIHTHGFREATVTAAGHSGMMEGAILLAYTGLRLLTDPVLRKEVKKAFNA